MPRNKIQSARKKVVLVETASVYKGEWMWRVVWCPIAGLQHHATLLQGKVRGTKEDAIVQARSLLEKMRYRVTTSAREYYGLTEEDDD